MTPLTKAQIEAMLATLGEVSADGREACEAYAEDLARTAIALHDRVAELERALKWYGEQARLARLIHSEGDIGRQSLAFDGGKRARATLERTTP